MHISQWILDELPAPWHSMCRAVCCVVPSYLFTSSFVLHSPSHTASKIHETGFPIASKLFCFFTLLYILLLSLECPASPLLWNYIYKTWRVMRELTEVLQTTDGQVRGFHPEKQCHSTGSGLCLGLPCSLPANLTIHSSGTHRSWGAPVATAVKRKPSTWGDSIRAELRTQYLRDQHWNGTKDTGLWATHYRGLSGQGDSAEAPHWPPAQGQGLWGAQTVEMGGRSRKRPVFTLEHSQPSGNMKFFHEGEVRVEKQL